MEVLINPIRAEKEYKELLREAYAQSRQKKPLPMLLTGLSDGARSAFYIAIAEDWKKKTGKKVLLIVPDEGAGYMTEKAFRECGLTAAVYPYRDFSYSKISTSHSYEHERLSVLDKIVHDKADIVISTPDAAMQYTVPATRLEDTSFVLRTGQETELEKIPGKLLSLGYVRVEMVEAEGQFSVRGGILDVFPPKCANPVRIEFFGDEVDRIAEFDIYSQRASEKLDCISLAPGRELVLGEEDIKRVLAVIENQREKCKNEKSRKELESEYEALKNGTDHSFLDKYISVIYPEKTTLSDYFSEGDLIIVQELNAVRSRMKSYAFQLRETEEMLIKEGLIPGKYADFGRSEEDFENFTAAFATVYCNTFTSVLEKLAGLYNIKSKQNISYRDNFPMLLEDLDRYTELGYRINILAENEAISQKLCETLLDRHISCHINGEPEAKVVNIVSGVNLAGFELTDTKYVCLSMYASVYTAGKLIKSSVRIRKKKNARQTVSSFAELEIGDYVVHENHGVGRYLGLSTVTVGGFTNDYIKIEYAMDGCLYLPCTQLDMLSKYLGADAEEGTVKLSKLGGAEWGKAKAKAKASAKEMAKELISLYSERMHREGVAFDEDDAIQQEFESTFEYEETEAQLEAAGEIKRDMERSVPMERLLCGDVGYGKTEVALRAAFKAVRSGYQVAFLVPTTILALQHYQTVLARMRSFPVTVDMLSRFRKPKEQTETLKKVKRGETDILIGTHRILSKDLEFKNLGLVIIDEEQRFGVAQKEKLKKIVKNVDVLTLSATPIPRTLNMAMSGIRDMSVLDEPPVDRIPVQTYVLEHDEEIVTEAVRKELRRGGQVFYMHNRVEDLGIIAGKLSDSLPEARIAVAHGQMDKEELSDIWREMLEGKIDILVCTTIIESGIDVPNANTLIIDDADRYGLAQLHQIRGRVGRSGRRAYAYLTYRKGVCLTPIAEKRLTAIRDFTEFGSGFRVAMRDMEIRGAGNLLGSEQHGQIESVGYDLYMKLLSEAVLEEKGETKVKRTECSVSMNIDAYIPEKYIRSSAQRISAYKKIASIGTEEDISDVYDELTDRYGDLPKQTETLLTVSLLRSLGGKAGFSKAEYRNNSVLLFAESMDAEALRELLKEYKTELFLSAGSPAYLTLKIRQGEDRMTKTADLLKKYIQITEKKV